MVEGGIKPQSASGAESVWPDEMFSAEPRMASASSTVAHRAAADLQGLEDRHSVAQQRSQDATEARHGGVVKDLPRNGQSQLPAITESFPGFGDAAADATRIPHRPGRPAAAGRSVSRKSLSPNRITVASGNPVPCRSSRSKSALELRHEEDDQHHRDYDTANHQECRIGHRALDFALQFFLQFQKPAIRVSASSRNAPSDPARIMLTVRFGKDARMSSDGVLQRGAVGHLVAHVGHHFAQRRIGGLLGQ